MSRRNIYFLRPVGERGPIKIGCSTMPQSRLRTYQIWSPVKLEIAAFAPAHRNTEMWLHRHFLDAWLHGEWFAWSDELQAVIDHAAQHGAMPDWVTPPTCPSEFRSFREQYPKGKTKETLREAAA